MADKLETIRLQTQKRVVPRRGVIQSKKINDNIKEVSHDLVNLTDQWNNRLVPLTDTLPNQDGTDLLDSFADGLHGDSIYANKDATSSSETTYYNTTNSRPNTILEQIADVYSEITDINAAVSIISTTVSNVTPIAANVSIADTGSLYIATNVESALAEVRQAVNNVSVGILDLSNVSQNYIPATDNTYNIGTSARRIDSIYVGPSSFHVTSKTSDSVNAVDVTYDIGINTDVTHAGKLEILQGGNVVARLSTTGAEFPNGVNQTLDDLTDVDASSPSDGDVIRYNDVASEWRLEQVASSISSLDDTFISSPSTGEALVFNGSIWVNGATDKSISDLTDVSSVDTPAKNDVVMWNGTEFVFAPEGTTFTFSTNTFTCTAGNNNAVFEIGTGTWQTIGSVSFSATYNNGPATDAYITHAGWSNLTMTNSFEGPTSSTEAISYPSVDGNKIFYLNATDGVDSDTNNFVRYYFRNRRFWGITSTASSFTEGDIEGLASNELSNSRAKSFTLNPGSGEYMLYCYPSRLGTATFVVGGFEGGFESPETVSVTNSNGYTENYYAYRSTNSNLGSTSVVVS